MHRELYLFLGHVGFALVWLVWATSRSSQRRRRALHAMWPRLVSGFLIGLGLAQAFTACHHMNREQASTRLRIEGLEQIDGQHAATNRIDDPSIGDARSPKHVPSVEQTPPLTPSSEPSSDAIPGMPDEVDIHLHGPEPEAKQGG
jgi:hypothetical protein